MIPSTMEICLYLKQKVYHRPESLALRRILSARSVWATEIRCCPKVNERKRNETAYMQAKTGNILLQSPAFNDKL